jgi:hypothetical protein
VKPAAERRLAAIEQRAAALPALTVPPEVAAWLRSLSNEQLSAVEDMLKLMIYGPPAETLTDAEAVQAWRELCRKSGQ